ncbi:hypothetical protein LNQ82_05880 [Conchiformibius steedae DSM 2580]|uniref:DNA-binding protein n=1 Tax=Conchiformibius steedae DSM 2580 TaxID=1121352 RepID=A0AAE9HRF0_9NEIS|nr:hypothetical protein [Conchiformibius steedae]QMT33994.1 hypothetical protein H3L98_02960 [Conchiformibius steedae]URD66764.1 hypothetical protein LNQ82_05880 [Conchiformibius steedae DSM 2580]
MSHEMQSIDDELAALNRREKELLAQKIKECEKILQSHGQEIAELQQRVTELESYRNSAIKADLHNGMTGIAAAKKYNLSPSRISQIKNSDKLN